MSTMLLQQENVDSIFLQAELGSSKGSNEELLAQIADRKARIIQTTEACENRIKDAMKGKNLEFDAAQHELEFERGVTKHYANLKNMLQGSVGVLEEEQRKTQEVAV
eukprot:gene854-17782_t